MNRINAKTILFQLHPEDMTAEVYNKVEARRGPV